MRLPTGYHVGGTALFVTLRVNQRKQNWSHLQPQPRGRLSKRTPIPSFFTHFVTFFCKVTKTNPERPMQFLVARHEIDERSRKSVD
jgi:hypothetical protein